MAMGGGEGVGCVIQNRLSTEREGEGERSIPG